MGLFASDLSLHSFISSQSVCLAELLLGQEDFDIPKYSHASPPLAETKRMDFRVLQFLRKFPKAKRIATLVLGAARSTSRKVSHLQPLLGQNRNLSPPSAFSLAPVPMKMDLPGHVRHRRRSRRRRSLRLDSEQAGGAEAGGGVATIWNCPRSRRRFWSRGSGRLRSRGVWTGADGADGACGIQADLDREGRTSVRRATVVRGAVGGEEDRAG